MMSAMLKPNLGRGLSSSSSSAMVCMGTSSVSSDGGALTGLPPLKGAVGDVRGEGTLVAGNRMFNGAVERSEVGGRSWAC